MSNFITIVRHEFQHALTFIVDFCTLKSLYKQHAMHEQKHTKMSKQKVNKQVSHFSAYVIISLVRQVKRTNRVIH